MTTSMSKPSFDFPNDPEWAWTPPVIEEQNIIDNQSSSQNAPFQNEKLMSKSSCQWQGEDDVDNRRSGAENNETEGTAMESRHTQSYKINRASMNYQPVNGGQHFNGGRDHQWEGRRNTDSGSAAVLAEATATPTIANDDDDSIMSMEIDETFDSFAGHFVAVGLSPSSTEWKAIDNQMSETMPSHRITEIARIQNTFLWEYFTFQKERMTKLSGGKEPNSVSVWHGTRGTHPLTICRDKYDGFKMQHSRQGMWGRGIYFAEDAGYSNRYAHMNNDGSRSMILAELLSGEESELCPNPSLIDTPMKPGGEMKYDTVTGTTKGSKVYVVYENGRAYPKYLVTYYA
mmetsp:Transcript_18062/g.25797  ORF Transcript_18062/g.25797 Transcript_18062/m.25797 type:complete len:344 (+) Transcript_18062:43-1074(+)